ncbi:hypothetical protein [Spongiactinospora gelatinilytica]|uniref:hypothetical protein n=1 Tax=Spongiactinospora gelatinilytica TaxID=2666298 RepID=UPI0011B94037|nr:hypothetical protein [Spongiactinospora gelatinilytica]
MTELRPHTIMPEEGRPKAKKASSAHSHMSARAKSFVDLAALVVVVAAPVLLVWVGQASVAVILAVAEFVAIVLRAWWRGHN